MRIAMASSRDKLGKGRVLLVVDSQSCGYETEISAIESLAAGNYIYGFLS